MHFRHRQTDGQTDGHWHRSISARYYTMAGCRRSRSLSCWPPIANTVYFSARCNIYCTSRAYATMSVSVCHCLSVCLWRLCIVVTGCNQWRNKVAVGPRASIPKGPPLPPKKLKKTASGKFWAPTALGPRALHALHALLLRHRVQWIPDTFTCLDRWMSLLLTDNASPGSSDRMMPGFLVEEGRGHLTLSWPLLGPLVINAENNKKTKKEKKSRVQDSAVSLSEIRHLIPNRFSYTVSGKKLCHFIFGSNFAKYWSILKIFSLLCSARNFW